MRALIAVLVVTLSPSLPAAAQASFDIPPYLFVDTAQAVTVAWRPLVPVDRPVVELFRRGVPWLRLEAERAGDVFRVALPLPCDLDDEVAYRVPGMTEPAPVERPSCAADKPIRFSFITDTQMDTVVARKAAERIAAQRPAFVLHGGDMVQSGGSDEQWAEYLRSIAPFARSRPLVPAAGNHDWYFDSEGENLAKFFGLTPEHAYFRYTAGAVDVFVLNSSPLTGREQRNAQLAWLRSALSDARRDRPNGWRVVVFHHPPFSLGIAHAGYLWEPRASALRKYYVPLFEDEGVHLVLNGHTHLFERSFKDGVHYLTGGAAGGWMGWFGGDNPYSSLSRQVRTVSHFEASADRLSVVTEDLEGYEVDRLELSAPAR